ncbi:MAG: serine--tRNA ligase [Clostridia bacterium]|nr:serine--tRNA ligase [Clostridia bacterium]
MIDINIVRNNPELVRENIKKKFQDAKLPLVDEVLALDKKNRELKQQGDDLRAQRKTLSAKVGMLMKEKRVAEAEEIKAQVKAGADRLLEIEKEQAEIDEKVKKIMMTIPNIIDSSVPIGKDDSENVEVQRFGEAKVPEYEIPYNADILESFCGLDKESAGRTSGNGFYYLMGDAARLVTAMISYARDYMIDKNFIYAIPPFMIRSDVVTGVMSFAEMDAMMYKIEGEDLYLIGTSEHSMIGKFKDQILKETELPITMTSYSPCFRKEVGAHGIEERGIYRVHQFEKQEMIVICKPEESMQWYEKMWQYTVEIFRNLNIPVRQLECCSGDLADLKVKSCDIEAWSPRQQKFFEVGSCSNLSDAQSRRLAIRTKGENGNYYPHTLNNTVLASTRALIALLENNYNADGSVTVPEVLRPYMGGKAVITPIKR